MPRPSETYIPADVLAILKDVQQEKGWTDVKKYNKFVRETMPNVPKSTVTRWTRAFTQGQAHSNTPTWHVRYRSNETFVPTRFSALRDGRLHAERDKWRTDGGIRYANVSDFHRPYNDGALLTLMGDVVKPFEPNVFPAFSDWLDMDRFNQHAPRPATAGEIIFDDSEEGQRRRNRLVEFKELAKETIDLVKEFIPERCTLVNMWGNHEQWLLRYLLGISVMQAGANDFVDYFINDVFTFLEQENVLWVEGDQNHWLPLTKEFFIAHGHKSRGGTGRTAATYLNSLRNSVSVAVGHSHRQELVTVNLPYGGQRFAAVAGTLGQLQPAYANKDFLGHNFGFQLIEHPLEGSRGLHVEDVRIRYQDGYYICQAFGKEYSQKAEMEYDEYMDFGL